MSKKFNHTLDPMAKSCVLCDEFDTEEMIACDKCIKWSYFACVSLDKATVETLETRYCVTCKVEDPLERGAGAESLLEQKLRDFDEEVRKHRQMMDDQMKQWKAEVAKQHMQLAAEHKTLNESRLRLEAEYRELAKQQADIRLRTEMASQGALGDPNAAKLLPAMKTLPQLVSPSNKSVGFQNASTSSYNHDTFNVDESLHSIMANLSVNPTIGGLSSKT